MNRWSKRYLYKLTFPNGMVYIGCTYDIKQRWAGKGAHYYGMKVYEAIKEFGWDNIKKEILLFLPDENGNSEKSPHSKRSSSRHIPAGAITV